MTLEKGHRLGVYEVLAPLGAGGMGEVWRATDTRLGRDVALKLLPQAFASDPDRLARFEREAKLLASLSHPAIAGLYALEEAPFDGGAPVRFLAMELALGENLAERLKRGPIPLDESLAVAKQVAEALEAAHEKGIVHRDLKPANVMLGPDARVKVLDFGLAKAWRGDGEDETASTDWSQSPTLARTGTAAGLILGTAPYMSPEQARGKPVDKRADVWAFGVVLFEMLTGKRLFDGETVSDVLAAVLTHEPRWNELPAATPPSVRRLLRHCLERNPRNRQHDIADVRVALDEALTGAADDATAPVATRRLPLWRRPAPWATLAGILGVALAAAFSALGRKAVAPPPPLRLSVELGAPDALVGPGAPLALSPDSRLLAFTARKSANEPWRLYLRPLDTLEATPLSGTEFASNPFFSPDSRWLGFFAGGKLKKVAVTGGAPVTLCNAPLNRGGTWSEDGTIVFMPSAAYGVGLSRVSSEGGKPEILTSADQTEGPSTDRWPQALPGGKAILFMAGVGVGDYESANILVQPVPGGPRKIVHRGGYYARFVQSGHLVFIRESTLFAARFDPQRLELLGPPVPVVSGVRSDAYTGPALFAVSDAGTLVFAPGQARRLAASILWMGADGRKEPQPVAAGNYLNLRFSPDGEKLVMDLRQGRDWDLWLYEWGRETMSRFTSHPGEDRNPIFSPDGRRITFTSTRADNTWKNLYWQRVDGTGVAERLTETESDQYPDSWHPNGRVLAFTDATSGATGDISILELEGDEASGFKPGKPRPIVNSSFGELGAAFSPDGRWLAYVSDEPGRPEIFVQPFPGPGGRWQVSTAGGRLPTWSRSRKELFFQALDGSLMVAAYNAPKESFRSEKPRLWSPGRVSLRGAPFRNFDLHPDGRRVAVLEPVVAGVDERTDHVVLVSNFFDELRRLAPAPR